IYFLNWNTGWAAGGYIENNLWGHMIILKTTNGGTNWVIQKDEPTDFYYPTSIYFLNEGYGFAACQGNNGGGTTGGIFKTTNGGTNWVMISGSKPASKIVFTNPSTAYCISKRWEDYNNIDTGIVYKSTDGGQNWNSSFRKYFHKFKNIVFINPNTGFVHSDSSFSVYSSYYKTTDAGNSWFLLSSGNTGHSASTFPNDSSGWAVGNQIYRSENGGINWTLNPITPTSQLGCIYFIDSYNGWSGGTNGALYQSVFMDTTSGDFFPLQIGNKFIYQFNRYNYWTGGGSSSTSGKRVMLITDTTTYNGKKYYLCSGIPNIASGWLRVDTVTKSLYAYSASNSCPYYYYETLVDSLGMTSTGIENSCHGYYCYGVSPVLFFNTVSNQIHFDNLVMDNNVLTTETHRYYHKKFGFRTYSSSYHFGTSGGSESYSLRGCIINGIAYGDTAGILVDINNIMTNVPNSYSLGQNFPNPFNPNTVICYQLPVVSDVSIKIYDVQGREVRTLVNERMNAGTYETTFDGSGLNSGVYFYQMRAGDFRESRRMILLK
ncbi:MAG: T9SS type A sorting domain-containing protein, partial [Candidatus Kapaibacterium sp.]